MASSETHFFSDSPQGRVILIADLLVSGVSGSFCPSHIRNVPVIEKATYDDLTLSYFFGYRWRGPGESWGF